MESLKTRKASREARSEGAFGISAVFVNSDKQLPELLAASAETEAQVSAQRLEAEADKAATIADSLKAQSKVAKRAAQTDADAAKPTEVKRQGAQSEDLAPGAKGGNGGGVWTDNKA